MDVSIAPPEVLRNVEGSRAKAAPQEAEKSSAARSSIEAGAPRIFGVFGG
jgi:hypothetical protein